MTEAKFTNPVEVLRFIFAGNSTFTFRSLRTGARFTYNVKMADKKNENDVNEKPVFFVKVLSGPDNTSDYTYIGMIRGATFGVTKASRNMANALSVKTFEWALTTFFKNVLVMPSQMEVWHTGRCGRCGRPLTVPESVASGIGPDCAAQMGKEQVTLPLNPSAPEIPVKRTKKAAKTTVDHYPGCRSDYPEKPEGEKAQKIERLDIGDGEAVDQCVDCGAFKVSASSVDQELEQIIEARVAEYRREAPENFYQDGMLDEEEATAVARNKFRHELQQDDRYLGSKFGELEAQQEAEAYRRMQ